MVWVVNSVMVDTVGALRHGIERTVRWPVVVRSVACPDLARTVLSVNMHPQGPRRPDMAIELSRAAGALFSLSELVSSRLGVVRSADDLVDDLSVVLERGEGSTHRDAVLSRCSEMWETEHARAFASACHEWADTTGLPVAAARTEAGWRRALGTSAKHRLDADAIAALPGTPEVITTYRVARLSELSRDAIIDIVASAYDSSRRTGNFDTTIRSLRRHGLVGAERLSWAVIGFESHQHVNLVWHQANKLQRVFPDRTAADLLSYGWLGLRVALAKFEPSLGFAFSTYACTRITGSIRDGVRAESPVPKRLGTFARKVAAAEAILTQSLGRSPSLEEISAYLGTEIERLAVLPRLAPEASVDELMDISGENGATPNWMVDEADPALEVERALTVQAINEALSRLPEDEAEAVRLLVMEELHPTKARQLTGASARQMRQRRDRALVTLRDFLEGWDPHISNMN